MGLVDEAISSENLLQLLEYMDKILEIYGGTRRSERVAAIAIQNSFFPLCSLYDTIYAGQLRNNIIVLKKPNS